MKKNLAFRSSTHFNTSQYTTKHGVSNVLRFMVISSLMLCALSQKTDNEHESITSKKHDFFLGVLCLIVASTSLLLTLLTKTLPKNNPIRKNLNSVITLGLGSSLFIGLVNLHQTLANQFPSNTHPRLRSFSNLQANTYVYHSPYHCQLPVKEERDDFYSSCISHLNNARRSHTLSQFESQMNDGVAMCNTALSNQIQNGKDLVELEHNIWRFKQHVLSHTLNQFIDENKPNLTEPYVIYALGSLARGVSGNLGSDIDYFVGVTKKEESIHQVIYNSFMYLLKHSDWPHPCGSISPVHLFSDDMAIKEFANSPKVNGNPFYQTPEEISTKDARKLLCQSRHATSLVSTITLIPYTYNDSFDNLSNRLKMYDDMKHNLLNPISSAIEILHNNHLSTSSQELSIPEKLESLRKKAIIPHDLFMDLDVLLKVCMDVKFNYEEMNMNTYNIIASQRKFNVSDTELFQTRDHLIDLLSFS